MNRQIRPKLRPALAFVLLFQALALAQSEPSPWHEFRVIRVKADMVDEWRELQMNDVNPALKAAGVPYRAVWRYVFGNPNEWWSVTPIAAFSQYDELGRERVPQELSQKLSRCVVGEHVHGDVLRSLSKKKMYGSPNSNPSPELGADKENHTSWERYYQVSDCSSSLRNDWYSGI